MPINTGYITAKTDKASDEVYTPRCAVTSILKWIEDFEACNNKVTPITIWCPFDTEDSNYVKVLKENKYNVIYSHIDMGQNFFYYEPEHYDLIISNPPFSLKVDILKRLTELDKPYAILFPLPSIQGLKVFPYLKKDTQLIIFDKRINFYKDKEMKTIQHGASFASIYVCKDFICEERWGNLIFEELNDE